MKPAGLSPDAPAAVLAVHAAAGTCGVLVHDARGHLDREEVRLESTLRDRPDAFGAAAEALELDHLLVLEEAGGGPDPRETRTRRRCLERASGKARPKHPKAFRTTEPVETRRTRRHA